MPDKTIPDTTDSIAEAMEDHVSFLEDYKSRMTPDQADKYIGRAHNTILGAIQRREIKHYDEGNGRQHRYKVTPKAIAEWLMTYGNPIEPDPLPS